MEKLITEMTLQEFAALPRADFAEDVGEITGIVMLPTEDTHDSGYRLVKVVACRHGVPLAIVACSDAIHLGGFIAPRLGAWTIDCLDVSGLLHVFAPGKELEQLFDLSSLEVKIKE